RRAGRRVAPRRPAEERALAPHAGAGARREGPRRPRRGERLARAGGPERGRHSVARRPRHVEGEAGQPLDEPDVELLAHRARAPRRAEATTTTQESSVSVATSVMACPASPVCTAV